MLGFDFSLGDVVIWLATSGVSIAAGIASYRRSRCLSSYPVWKSVATGLLASVFTLIWLILWAVNRRAIAAEWRDYRAAHGRTRILPVDVRR